MASELLAVVALLFSALPLFISWWHVFQHCQPAIVGGIVVVCAAMAVVIVDSKVGSFFVSGGGFLLFVSSRDFLFFVGRGGFMFCQQQWHLFCWQQWLLVFMGGNFLLVAAVVLAMVSFGFLSLASCFLLLAFGLLLAAESCSFCQWHLVTFVGSGVGQLVVVVGSSGGGFLFLFCLQWWILVLLFVAVASCFFVGSNCFLFLGDNLFLLAVAVSMVI